ncbi:ABC transporter ATP-binding protein [Aliikangiella sp. IMCC44359]|uniref:ABC transporter ATP-binding protein n=1 Tax=Aliikangiella sp. IMCC44359 TaxID=3459125 RepID=UPI00403B16A0
MKKKAIEIKNLEKVYKNGVQALKGISFEVEEGDFIALLGPNGAGKSTTIGIISSLVNKSAGQVEVFGHSIDKDLEAAKRCIGLVPQEFNFSQFETCLQIVVNQAGYYGVPRKIAYQRAEEVLKQLSLWDKRNTPSRELSGGMKRRLMIARALIHHPKILILDEPTAGVDIEIRRSMWDFLTQLNEQGTTIVLTTHYLEEAEQLCRNIAIINQGLIVENCSMKALISRLDLETFILDVEQVPDTFPDIENVCFRQRDNSTIEVDVPREVALNLVFDWLSSHQVKVLSMRNKSNRLEELFVQLTE